MTARFELAHALSVIALGLVPACAEADKEPASAADTSRLVGNPAPDFEVKTVASPRSTISLGELRGKVVVLDFWGTFCEPCKKSFPKLQELSEKYQASGLRVVGISEDEDEDKDKIPAFAATYGAKFALVWDRDKSIARQYKPETMPSSFIIDRSGIVRFEHVGFHDGEEVEVEKEVRGLLGH
jgi:cytochrome c biogenesis protein CcmG/thiol:disulfide interchange protein DsbE